MCEQNKQLQQSNTSYTTEITNLKHTLNTTITTTDDKLTDIMTKYETQLNVYREKYNQCELQYKQCQQQLQQTTLNLTTELNTVKSHCISDTCKLRQHEYMEQIHQLKHDNKLQYDTINELNKKINKLKANESKLSAQLDTQINDKQLLETKYVQIGDKLNELLKHDETQVSQLITNEQTKRHKLKDDVIYMYH